MKICIACRCPFTNDLQDGNLTSEERFERQVLEASLSNKEVTEIYTSRYEWKKGYNISSKYKGLVTNKESKNCILLMHDYNENRDTIYRYEWKSILIWVFAGLWVEQRKEIRALEKKYKNSFFLVISYPDSYQSQKERFIDYCNLVDIENFISLPVPIVPYLDYADRFTNKVFLWSQRPRSLNTVYENSGTIWALQKLQQDSSLQLHIVTSFRERESLDHRNGQVVKGFNPTLYLWSLPEMQKYSDVKERVFLLGSISRQEVLNEYSKAKLAIPFLTFNSSPGFEASMFGVPFITNGGWEKNVYLNVETPEEHTRLLEKLSTDHSFYIETANKNRDYINQLYTYTAFNKNLNRFLATKELL